MRFHILPSIWVVALLACSSAGCRNEEQVGVPVAVPAESEKRDPVAQFNDILERFERDMETDVPGAVSGFTVIEDGGRSRLSFETNVSHELVPPKKPTDTYRAVITVATRSRYSVTLPAEEEGKDSDEKDDDASEADNEDDRLVLDDLSEDPTTGLFESEPAEENESRPRPRVTEEVLSTPASENVQKFELAFEGDRWVLKTKPDKESIEDALERALRLQY